MWFHWMKHFQRLTCIHCHIPNHKLGGRFIGHLHLELLLGWLDISKTYFLPTLMILWYLTMVFHINQVQQIQILWHETTPSQTSSVIHGSWKNGKPPWPSIFRWELLASGRGVYLLHRSLVKPRKIYRTPGVSQNFSWKKLSMTGEFPPEIFTGRIFWSPKNIV